MEMTNRNNRCDGCPFLTHSGAFTPGGAQAVCGHKAAYKSSHPVPEIYCTDHKRIDRYHWWHRRVGEGDPSPFWCPLKR